MTMDSARDALQSALGWRDVSVRLPTARSSAWQRARMGLQEALLVRGLRRHVRSPQALWILQLGASPFPLGATRQLKDYGDP